MTASHPPQPRLLTACATWCTPPVRPPRLPAGLAQQEPVQRILPSGVYSIRLEQGRAGCEFRGE